jgi:hypothetical protein
MVVDLRSIILYNQFISKCSFMLSSNLKLSVYYLKRDSLRKASCGGILKMQIEYYRRYQGDHEKEKNL